MSAITRRALLSSAVGAALAPLAACSAHEHASADVQTVTGDFPPVEGFEREVRAIGPDSGARLLLLHELPGLTPDDIALARKLAGKGFKVYVPLLFGDVGQSSTLAGYWQACVRGEFKCGTRSARSPILDWLERVSDRIVGESKQPLGIIGMCLTGILPLALLREGVRAAVLCQPTLPFNAFFFRPVGDQKKDLGLGAADRDRARKSSVPILTMHYASDKLCPPERVALIEETFPERVATIALSGEGHSSLAKHFNQQAFDDTVDYLRVRLGVEPGPRVMKAARFRNAPCQIGPDGTWKPVSAATD